MDVEKRTYSAAPELRADEKEGSRTIEGYAAVFGENSVPIWGIFIERIAPEAFNEADMSDVRALLNHDANIVFGRTKADTLKLSIDERGLKYSFEAPETTAGNDLLVSVARGDISQSSFAFQVDSDEWTKEDGKDIRTIRKVSKVFDVSPVTYPAYEGTEVAKRSLDALRNPEVKTQPADFYEYQEKIITRI